jgi:hypothetical protein
MLSRSKICVPAAGFRVFAGMKPVLMLLAASLIPALAQEIKLPASLDRLASKAEETVDITLDKNLLRFAGGFLSGRGDEARARSFLSGLESITVKSFEFAREGEYNAADLDAVRAQLTAPAWSKIVGVKSVHGENVDIYIKMGANGQAGGVVVLAAEPRELTIVVLVGTIDPAKLADLGGQFHIPAFRVGREDR